jgi:putative transposase
MLKFFEHTNGAVCTELDAELIAFNREAGYHVHLVALPAHLAISALVHRHNGRTLYATRREFTGRCVRACLRAHLWSPSYRAV